MKKKIVTAIAGVLASSMVLAGCSASKGLETDNIKITQYKGVEVEEVEKPAEITDKDVEASIQSTLDGMATPNERAVADGDTVNIDFVGKIDGVEFDGGTASAYDLTIGSDSTIDGFEDSIIGHVPGETFDWSGRFPDDYATDPEKAGKDVTFTITVNYIDGEQTVPELTDDLVKSTLSEKSKTVKEYKKEVKKDLQTSAETTYNDTLSSSVWQKVLDNTEVTKYPKKDVSEISDTLIQQYKDAAEYYQQDYEAFIKEQMKSTVEDFEKQVEDAAKASVKQTLVTEAIADKEKIKIDDETYKKELKDIAAQYGYEDVDSLKAAAKEEDLKDIVLNNLVKDWLAEHCVQVAATESSSDKE